MHLVRHVVDDGIKPRLVGHQLADEARGVAGDQHHRQLETGHRHQYGHCQGAPFGQGDGRRRFQHPRQAVDDHHQEQGQGEGRQDRAQEEQEATPTATAAVSISALRAAETGGWDGMAIPGA